MAETSNLYDACAYSLFFNLLSEGFQYLKSPGCLSTGSRTYQDAWLSIETLLVGSSPAF
jgi:hypothetical protein